MISKGILPNTKYAILWTLFTVVLFSLACYLPGCAQDPYIRKLQYDISQAPYSSEDYIQDEFDCSNMTNFLDNWLEEKGYDTKILVYYPSEPSGIQKAFGTGFEPSKPFLKSHAVLLVDNNTIVESVTKRIVKHGKNEVVPRAFGIMNRTEDTLIESTVSNSLIPSHRVSGFGTGALIFPDAENLLSYMPMDKWQKEWGYNKFLGKKNSSHESFIKLLETKYYQKRFK
ncbi:MAG: hypothetical protein ACUVUQ_05710 [Thermodesulfovibrionales bacterium]